MTELNRVERALKMANELDQDWMNNIVFAGKLKCDYNVQFVHQLTQTIVLMLQQITNTITVQDVSICIEPSFSARNLRRGRSGPGAFVDIKIYNLHPRAVLIEFIHIRESRRGAGMLRHIIEAFETATQLTGFKFQVDCIVNPKLYFFLMKRGYKNLSRSTNLEIFQGCNLLQYQ